MTISRRRPTTIAILALTALLSPALTSVHAAPSLVFDPPRVELGVIEGDDVVPYSIRIRNDGDETLIIESVNTTCGCTVATLADSLIQPGESVEVSGTYDSRKMTGEIRKTIFLRSNDDSRKRAVLMIKAFVVRGVSLSKKRIHFASVRPKEESVRTIEIRSDSSIPLKIESVSLTHDYFCWNIEELERPGDYKIDIILDPPKGNMALKDSVVIRTNIEEFREFYVPIVGRIKARGKRKL